MKTKFKSVPQRGATSFDKSWTSNFSRRGRRPSAKTIAENRAIMDAYTQRVLAGEIKPLIIPTGQREL